MAPLTISSTANPLTERATAPGAYGLRLLGLDVDHMLPRVDATAPALEISLSQGRVTHREQEFLSDRAEISLLDDGWISLSRAGRAAFTLPERVPAEELLHPWLVPAAATFNGWLGRQVLHGGVLAQDGRALAVLGEKEAGKSSLFAWLASTGRFDILADDLVIVDRGEVLAGPRCIDLRPGSAEAVAGAHESRIVRDATRLRLELPACPNAAWLAGIVILAWSEDEDISVQRLTPSQAVASLLPHASGCESGLHGGLLELLALPVWLLTRRRTWSIMPRMAEHLERLMA